MKVKDYLKLSRAAVLEHIIGTYPEPQTLAYCGNMKLGKAIGHISSLAKLSCIPSEWCLGNCYALWSNQKLTSSTFDRVGGMKLYIKNAWFSHLSEHDPERLSYKLRHTFKTEPWQIYRFFVEGDWEFAPQIEVVERLLKNNPYIRIFFFTRSWVNQELREHLERLMRLPNVRGFASTDATMPPIPKGWNEAGVLGAHQSTKGIVCPEQLQEVSSCSRCGLCMDKRIQKNILFIDHRAPEYRGLKKLQKEGRDKDIMEIRKTLKRQAGQIS